MPTKQTKTKQKSPMKIPFAENFCRGSFALLPIFKSPNSFLIFGVFLLPSHEGLHSLTVASSNFPCFKQISFFLGTKHAGLLQLCSVPKQSCHKATCRSHCSMPAFLRYADADAHFTSLWAKPFCYSLPGFPFSPVHVQDCNI